jgi:haloalkane dehalogenase
MDPYRTPDDRFEGLHEWPFAPRYVDHEGLRMHYVAEGGGDAIVLLHGEPTWGYLYRRLIPPLAAVGRVLVPDLFGFGRSDKPTRIEDYSFELHYRSIERFALELELRRLTLVVHDWGGPIGLRFAVEHPERVERLVVLNTGIGAGRAPSPDWLRFRELVRRVGTELAASRIVQGACLSELSDDVLRGYDAPFPVAEAKSGALAFPELVPTELEHPSAAAMLRIREGLTRWEKPTLVLFSDSDRVFSPAHAERLAARIPGSGAAEIVTGAGHFLQEDRGEQIAERIVRFLAETAAQDVS